MKTILNLHSLFTPLIVFPIAFLAWYNEYHDYRLTWITLSFPIIYAYLIPYFAIKKFHLWEFRSKYSLKGFRPQSGFIYGSFASLLTWVGRIDPGNEFNFWKLIKQAFILGSLIGFWNWLFEIVAIQRGIIIFYGKSFLKKSEPATITLEYAPVGFGLNGFGLGCLIYINFFIKNLLLNNSFFWVYPIEIIIYLALPVLGYSYVQYQIHGEYGFKSYKPT